MSASHQQKAGQGPYYLSTQGCCCLACGAALSACCCIQAGRPLQGPLVAARRWTASDPATELGLAYESCVKETSWTSQSSGAQSSQRLEGLQTAYRDFHKQVICNACVPKARHLMAIFEPSKAGTACSILLNHLLPAFRNLALPVIRQVRTEPHVGCSAGEGGTAGHRARAWRQHHPDLSKTTGPAGFAQGDQSSAGCAVLFLARADLH